MILNNKHRWMLALLLPFAIGFIQSFGEEKDANWVHALQHGLHGLLPSLIGLNMTLTKENDNDASK